VLNSGVEKTIEEIEMLYGKLGEMLSKDFGSKNMSFGDEQGYSLDFKNNFEPIEILKNLLYGSTHKEELNIGIDAAASSFYDGNSYKLEGDTISSEKLLTVYDKYFEDCDLLRFIEDPFAEEDKDGFSKIFRSYGESKLFIGDDLTTTNKKMIKEFANKLINAVIIKPNQIGTVSETCDAMSEAAERGIERIVSHRSGEVDDAFLVHFAKAAGAEGVKMGVPVIKQRISKINELKKLYATNEY